MERSGPDASRQASESIGESALGFAGLSEFMGRQATPTSERFPAGSKIGDVTIVRMVDEGGMGRVYEGLQGVPCRSVAVKIIRPGVLSSAAAKRFAHEAHILGRLNHPGICRIYSVGLERLPGGEVPYFVMEYIEDALAITAYASRQNLTTRDRVTLFREACRAVAHGHQKGIIHRDLKPGNILADSSGQLKIIDFGVARSTDGEMPLTTMHTDVGQLVGTLAYMSPEHFDGSTDNIDVRTDVYALGVVLYELLTGSMPYDISKRPVYDVARVVREVDPKSLSAANPKLRGDLNTIVAKCLEKDRGRRYSSAAELEADLGRYLRGEPISASPTRLLDSVARVARRHRLAAMATVGVVAALVLAILGISVFALRADVARRDAIHLAVIAAREREAARLETKRADTEAYASRQQLYVANLRALNAFLDSRNLRPARQLFAANAAIAGDPLPLELHCMRAKMDDALAVIGPGLGHVSAITYSPAGDVIAIAASTHPSLSKWRLLDWKSHQAAFKRDSLSLTRKTVLCFGVNSQHDHQQLRQLDEGWLKAWSSRIHSGSGEDGGTSLAQRPLSVSADGRLAAAAHLDGDVCILNEGTGDVQAVLARSGDRLRSAAFSPDGSRLLGRTSMNELGLWHTGDGRLLATIGGGSRRVMSFHFSPDGSRLALVVDSSDAQEHRAPRALLVYDAGDGTHLSTVVTHGSQLPDDTLVAFSPDNRRLVTSSHENDAGVWAVADGASISTLTGHVAVVTAVAFSPDGRQIVTGAANGHIHLWDAETFARQRELIGHEADVRALAFSPDGESLASGSIDGTVRIWSRLITEPLSVVTGLRDVTATAFSPDGGLLAVASKSSAGVELWNPRTVSRLHALEGPGGTVAHIAYSRDGGYVAAAFRSPELSGGVCVWNTATGERVQTFGERGRGMVTVAFSSDGARLLTTADDTTTILWELRTGSRLVVDSGNYNNVAVSGDVGAVFGLNGGRLAYKKPLLFDGTTGAIVAKLQRQGHVTCLATSPDGRLLATGQAIGTICLTDFQTGKRLATIVAHTGSVRSLAFSHDGSHLLSGATDGTVGMWDTATGRSINVLHGHENSVEAVMFSRDGRRIITAATDGTVRIWITESAQEVCSLPGQRDFPKTVALSPDGRQLVTAAANGTVRIWGLSNADVLAARRAAADRDAHLRQ